MVPGSNKLEISFYSLDQIQNNKLFESLLFGIAFIWHSSGIEIQCKIHRIKCEIRNVTKECDYNKFNVLASIQSVLLKINCVELKNNYKSFGLIV